MLHMDIYNSVLIEQKCTLSHNQVRSISSTMTSCALASTMCVSCHSLYRCLDRDYLQETSIFYGDDSVVLSASTPAIEIETVNFLRRRCRILLLNSTSDVRLYPLCKLPSGARTSTCSASLIFSSVISGVSYRASFSACFQLIPLPLAYLRAKRRSTCSRDRLAVSTYQRQIIGTKTKLKMA